MNMSRFEVPAISPQYRIALATLSNLFIVFSQEKKMYSTHAAGSSNPGASAWILRLLQKIDSKSTS